MDSQDPKELALASSMSQWVKNSPAMQETQEIQVRSLSWEVSPHFISGGNGNPLQSFCLENSMDRGAWWATVYGVSRTRPK